MFNSLFLLYLFVALFNTFDFILFSFAAFWVFLLVCIVCGDRSFIASA